VINDLNERCGRNNHGSAAASPYRGKEFVASYEPHVLIRGVAEMTEIHHGKNEPCVQRRNLVSSRGMATSIAKILRRTCLALALVLNTISAPSEEKPRSDRQNHWAFRKPTRPALPMLKERSANVNPIDLFIAAEHEKLGLSALPEAPKHTLLRRVYVSLTGLPPTLDQLRAFLSDQRSDAYERVVDQLLGSPQYGERWGRHWMDVWRYSDWYGRREVPDVWNSAPQIWRWRDWIVRSLNANKGYDQMIREMLAGDEFVSEDAAIATGFLARNWYALNPNQWMRDNVEHTAKAFLGLTLNCAHCHDHKYDPISQKEYFQFRAFFEPLGLRQDRVSGEPDPGPFQKYDYSTLRKVIKDGAVSVFDENLHAQTRIYLHGDERIFPDDKPTVGPAVPAFLSAGPVDIRAIDLPAHVFYPGSKPFIRQSERERHVKSVDQAREKHEESQKQWNSAQRNLTQLSSTNSLSDRFKQTAAFLAAEAALRLASNRLAVAVSDQEALEARISVDLARFDGSMMDDTNELAKAANRAEKQSALLHAKTKLHEVENMFALLEAEQELASARQNLTALTPAKEKEAKEKQEAALKQAREQIAKARKELADAEAGLKTNSLAYTPLSPIYPAKSSGRRRALAEWITSRNHPLTARVAVNHMWARHFQAPLVKSVFDFGRNGSRPTHPELLDWLAVELIESGWSMKHLHRLIVTSAAYRRASVLGRPGQGQFAGDGEGNAKRDPENQWLWRMNSVQMEAEVVRDSILYLAGGLDAKMGGYPLANAETQKSPRRSLYFECHPEAGGHGELTALFDPPDPNECYRRTRTVMPQQALALSNSELAHGQSRRLVERLSRPETDTAEFIMTAYEHVLSRSPGKEELSACATFLQKQDELFRSQSAEPSGQDAKRGEKEAELTPTLRARASLVHALFNHNDFVMVR